MFLASSLAAALLSLSSAAHAGCDAKGLVKEINDAGPARTASAFIELADCDAALAKKVAPQAVPRVLPTDGGHQAVVKAIEVGAPQAAVAWLDGQQADDRSKGVASLGASCTDSAAVQAFFSERAKTLGDKFWADRWYRGLANCKAAVARDLLWAQLEKGVGADRTLFFGVLESYARNAGKEAVPKLVDLAKKTTDPETQTYVVNSFADAAQLGSASGRDEAAVQLVIAAIVELAPSLDAKAVDQARITLQSLEAEAEADKLAGVRFKAVAQKDGRYLYGTVVAEVAKCKNGKTLQKLHVSQVTDGGTTWPDQLKDKVETNVNSAWTMDTATRCKGEGAIQVRVPGEPFADEEAYKAWSKETVKEMADPALKVPSVIEHDPINL